MRKKEKVRIAELEAERDEWQRKYELERGHVLRGVTGSEWIRRDIAEEEIAKAEAERDAATNAMDNLARKLTEAEDERDAEHIRAEAYEYRVTEAEDGMEKQELVCTRLRLSWRDDVVERDAKLNLLRFILDRLPSECSGDIWRLSREYAKE